MAFEAGLLLGERFRLVNRIAEGALGELWRGADRLPTNQVAVRLVTPKNGVTTAALDAFVEEMRTARAIRHRSMAKVLGAGRTADGVPWVATELLRAESLESLLERRGTLLPGAALHLISDLAGALAEAHAHGIAHRAIEPRSVLLHLDEKGAITAKLIDFGRGRLLAPSPRELRTNGNVPPYACPELLVGAKSGPEADVWALGVLLFRCVMGRLPFPSETAASFTAQARAVAKILNDVEDPAVRRITEECLRYARDQRPTAESLADGAQLAAWSTRGGFADLAKMVRIPEPFLDAEKYGQIAHWNTIPGLARQEASVPPPEARKKVPPRAAPPPLPIATPFLLEMPKSVPSDPTPLPVSEPPVAISVTREARTEVELASHVDFRPAWSPWRKRAVFVAAAGAIAGLIGAVSRTSPPRRARAAAAARVADAPVPAPKPVKATPRPAPGIVVPIASAASPKTVESTAAPSKTEPKQPKAAKRSGEPSSAPAMSGVPLLDSPKKPQQSDDNPYD